MVYKLGELLELVTENNSELKYGIDDIIGVTIEKQIIPTIANLKQTDLSKFIIVKPNDFIYNPRTHGKKIGLGYNKSKEIYIATWNNNVFRVKEDMKDIVMSDYLYLFFCKETWDKEACFNSWGSSTVVLLWENFCNMEINLPDIMEQKKIIKQYYNISKQKDLIQQQNDILLDVGINELTNLIGNEDIVGLSSKEINNIKIKEKCHITSIDNYCKKITSGGTPNRGNDDYYNGNINWLKSGEVHNNVTTYTEEKITNKGLNNSSAKIFPKGTILMAMYGATAGEVGYLDIESATNQAICGMICENEKQAAFLYFSLIKNQESIKRLSNGGAQDNLSQDIIKNTNIIVPNDIDSIKLNVLLRQIIINYNILMNLDTIQKCIISKIK